MIKVYPPTTDDFTKNGDPIQPTRAIIHKADNSDFYLELESNLDYMDLLESNNIIVAPTPQGEQAFRLGVIEASRNKIKSQVKHVFYDSENYLIEDSYVVNKNCNEALDHLNNATDNQSPFTTLSDVNTINSYRCVRKTLAEAINTVLDRWSGHLVRNNFNIEIRESIGADNGVTIQYKKNLKDISVVYDWSNVCTKILPVGKDGLTIGYLFSEIQYDLPYTRTVSFNQEINREDYETDEEYNTALVDDLTAQAEKYLEIYQYPSVSYTLNANIDKITDIGDTIVVYDERLGVNIKTQVTAYDYDCILGKYISVQFGTAPKTLTDLKSTISSDIDNSINENNQVISVTLKDSIDKASQAIWSALSSSYVIYQGNQILVVDRLPAKTATHAIRINSGGIAFSNTGIAPESFVSVWSIDGTFNAQAINVINFTADLIKGGTLKLGSVLGQNGKLELYDDSNNLIGLMGLISGAGEPAKYGLKMYGIDGSYIVMNNEVGFTGYDRLNNRLFWVSKDEFHMKKSVVEQEITLCNKMRFIPIELYNNGTLINNGIALVSVLEQS